MFVIPVVSARSSRDAYLVGHAGTLIASTSTGTNLFKSRETAANLKNLHQEGATISQCVMQRKQQTCGDFRRRQAKPASEQLQCFDALSQEFTSSSSMENKEILLGFGGQQRSSFLVAVS